MKSKFELADDRILHKLKMDGRYSKASFFLGVVRIVTEFVFSEPVLIDLIKERQKR